MFNVQKTITNSSFQAMRPMPVLLAGGTSWYLSTNESHKFCSFRVDSSFEAASKCQNLQQSMSLQTYDLKQVTWYSSLTSEMHHCLLGWLRWLRWLRRSLQIEFSTRWSAQEKMLEWLTNCVTKLKPAGGSFVWVLGCCLFRCFFCFIGHARITWLLGPNSGS